MKHPLGNLTRESDGFKVVFERIFDHDIQVVWEAITLPEKLKIWFTDFEMEFKEGSKIRIHFRDAEKSVTEGQIVTIDPPRKFAWTWEGELAVWELESKGKNKCKLTLAYTKLADQNAVGASAGFHTLLDRLEIALNGSNETYAFGTEENDPAQIKLREVYGNSVYKNFPELEVYHPIRMERTYNAPIAKVWAALTEPEQQKKWYFDFSGKFKLEQDHEFEWMAGPPDGKQWLHRGKITEVIPQKKLAHTWEYPGYIGKAQVSWELEETTDQKTKLVLTYKILIPFDPKEEALRRNNFVEGWNEIVHTGLKKFLEG